MLSPRGRHRRHELAVHDGAEQRAQRAEEVDDVVERAQPAEARKQLGHHWARGARPAEGGRECGGELGQGRFQVAVTALWKGRG